MKKYLFKRIAQNGKNYYITNNIIVKVAFIGIDGFSFHLISENILFSSNQLTKKKNIK